MLVLTRKKAETLVIGDQIKITVLEIDGDKVKLGIDAPRDIKIHRLEVFEAITRENKEAAKIEPALLGDLAFLLHNTENK